MRTELDQLADSHFAAFERRRALLDDVDDLVLGDDGVAAQTVLDTATSLLSAATKKKPTTTAPTSAPPTPAPTAKADPWWQRPSTWGAVGVGVGVLSFAAMFLGGKRR